MKIKAPKQIATYLNRLGIEICVITHKRQTDGPTDAGKLIRALASK